MLTVLKVKSRMVMFKSFCTLCAYYVYIAAKSRCIMFYVSGTNHSNTVISTYVIHFLHDQIDT